MNVQKKKATGTNSRVSLRARRTQKDRRSDSEEALLNAAAELFAEQGIEKTSVAAICHHAGYSHGLINRHFGSKDVLVETLAVRCQQSFVDGLDSSSAENGREAIVTAADEYLKAFAPASPMARCFIVMWGAALATDAGHESFRQVDEDVRQRVVVWLESGVEDGSVSSQVNLSAFSAMLIAMLRGLAAQILISPENIDLGTVRREVTSFIEMTISKERAR